MIVTSGLQNISSITKRCLRKSGNNAQKTLLDFLHYADIQVNEIRAEREPVDLNSLPSEVSAFLKKTPRARPPEQDIYYFGHDYFDNEKNVGAVFLPEHEESSGTQKLFSYSIPITWALENGTPLFIDEFDAQLHPLILEHIIKLFNSPEKNRRTPSLLFPAMGLLY